MTSQEFIEKWAPGGASYAMTEKAGAQQHFLELCALLGVEAPNDSDHYTFEKGTLKLGEARGFADVFKRGAFAWENKGPNADLKAALKQLKMYASALDNPPLLVVSDRLVVEVHTQFTGTPTEVHRFTLKDLADPARCTLLRKVWTQPEAFKPKRTSRDITEAAAKAFAEVANRMRDERKVAPERVAHFLTQCVFCFFAEDAGLLPQKLFDRLVSKQLTPEKLHGALVTLFETMRDGGLFGTDDIPWFNGGLFKTIDIPTLTPMDVAALSTAAQENWSAIDVSIFGTLFERGLDPAKRSQLGAHYTDPATIMRIVNPVVLRPLQAEWAGVKVEIEKELKKSKKHADAAWGKAANRFNAWLERLKAYRVLDPACGSGNFLYLALRTLKDFELTTHLEAEMLSLLRPAELVTSPANVLGIELNEYAAELARVTVWIGELQWCLDHAYPFKQNPVLEPLDHIENRDALLSWDAYSLPLQGSELNSLPQRGRVGEGETSSPDKKLYLPKPLPAELKEFVRNLRNNPTDAERAMWQILRGNQLGVKFRRQHPMAGYVLDFYCIELKLAIELDGGQHNSDEGVAKDTARTAALAREGVHVVRFWNDEVFKNIDGIWEAISNEISDLRLSLAGERTQPSAPEGARTQLPPPAGERTQPAPPAGEGWGGGSLPLNKRISQRNDLPPPQPSPAGGGSKSAAAVGLGGGAREAQWPKADAVIGNPPFVGDRKMIRELGEGYTDTLRTVYAGKVPGGADLVCYWFYKGNEYLLRGTTRNAGFVSTNSIRGGANRKCLDAIMERAVIHDAWSDEPWVNDGAAVRVSLVSFGVDSDVFQLNGHSVDGIFADLTPASKSGADLTTARKLHENFDFAYVGVQRNGPFDIDSKLARDWLSQPNVDGKSNSEVLVRAYNAIDLTRREEDRWLIDFRFDKSEDSVAGFERPFAYVLQTVKATRIGLRRSWHATYWWLFGDPRPAMRSAIRGIERYILTPQISKHRVFRFVPTSILTENANIALAREDDATFGILQSRFHELWSLAVGTALEDRPRYTNSTTVETFPFPAGLTPADTAHQRTETLPDGALIPADLLPPPAGEGWGGGSMPANAAISSNSPPSQPPPAGGRSFTAMGENVRICAAGIASAAKKLNDLRERWLNPPEWTQRVPEIIPLGMEKSPYPDRILPRDGLREKDLKALQKRTLTNLYNERPAWLANAHTALDLAVARAYGWADYAPDLPDDEILSRLLKLNLERAAAQEKSARPAKTRKSTK